MAARQLFECLVRPLVFVVSILSSDPVSCSPTASHAHVGTLFGVIKISPARTYERARAFSSDADSQTNPRAVRNHFRTPEKEFRHYYPAKPPIAQLDRLYRDTRLVDLCTRQSGSTRVH